MQKWLADTQQKSADTVDHQFQPIQLLAQQSKNCYKIRNVESALLHAKHVPELMHKATNYTIKE